MTKLLIAKNEREILMLKQSIKYCFPYIKAVNGELKKLIAEYTITDINELIHNFKHGKQLHTVEDFIQNKLLSHKDASSFSIAGIILKREKVKEMIQIGDCSPLFAALNNLLNQSDNIAIYSFRNLFELKDGEIIERTDIDSYIDSLYSYYTENDKQDEEVKHLNRFIDELDLLCSKIHNVDVHKREIIKAVVTTGCFTQESSELKPSINYIRSLK